MRDERGDLLAIGQELSYGKERLGLLASGLWAQRVPPLFEGLEHGDAWVSAEHRKTQAVTVSLHQAGVGQANSSGGWWLCRADNGCDDDSDQSRV